VSGLQAQSFALQNISGNIANSQTTGYKDINTGFADLVS
jgi:flagellar hook protein FlgE